MRDPGRIPAVMAKLQAIWEKYPDMRLGQLLMAAVQAKDPEADLFHVRDGRLVEMLEGFRNWEPVPIPNLEDLVAGITPENISDPAETDFGPDVGREVIDFDYELGEEDKRVLRFAKRQLKKIIKKDGGWDNSPVDTGSAIYTDEMIDAETRFTMLIRTAKRRMARIIERDDVLACAIEVLETPDNAIQWLNSPVVALDGKVPADLLDTDEGVKLVLTILTRIEYGVFS